MNNKGAGQTARMRRLICAFGGRIWQKRVFSWHGSFHIKPISFQHLRSFTFPHVEVSDVISLDPVNFELQSTCSDEAVVITPPCAHTGPAPVQVRLISHALREGQVGILHPSEHGYTWHGVARCKKYKLCIFFVQHGPYKNIQSIY